MKNPDKEHRGFVVKAKPAQNPESLPDRYVFSGIDLNTNKRVIYVMTLLPLPGFVSPEDFEEHVRQRNPLPGTLVTFPDDYTLGKFTYIVPETGAPVTVDAKDIRVLTLEQIREPIDRAGQRAKLIPPTPPLANPARKRSDVPEDMPELMPPSVTQPDLPTPKPKGRGMELSF